MKQTTILLVFSVLCGVLAFQVVRLKQEVHQLQINCAVAVLSAEAANRKVGAISPFFAPDKEEYLRGFIDANNLPASVFPPDVLDPIRERLERAHNGPEAEKIRKTFFR